MFSKSPGQHIFESYHGHFNDIDYPLWLNLGYWKQAITYRDACAALARYVAEEALLGDGDVVLDAGFGFAEPARFWAQKYNVQRIVGLNNNRFQFEIAADRLRAAGLEKCIRLLLHSATSIPFADQSFDKVIALESGFQFDTREKFFREAFRILRPEGRLVIADLLPLPAQDHASKWQQSVRRHFGIPEANMSDRFACAETLRNEGFQHVAVLSIREYVYPAIAKLVRAVQEGADELRDIEILLSSEDIKRCAGVEWWQANNGLTDFAIVVACKSASCILEEPRSSCGGDYE